MSRRTGQIELTRLTAGIGAEIHGVDLTAGVDATIAGLLRTAIAEHHMVVLRGQHLTAEQHAELARAFGTIQPSPVQLATQGQLARATVSTIEDTEARPPAGFGWHTDVSWRRDPPQLGFLAAVVIPEFGGDTLWASTAAVYDALPRLIQERCERASVVHSPDPSLLASVERHHGAAVAERLRREFPGAEHPLVRTNPITGRKALFLSPLYTQRIVGPAGADGKLMRDLNQMLDDPHVQVRWRWAAGDVVIWDEAGTCHRALTDHHPQRRVMRRCVTRAGW